MARNARRSTCREGYRIVFGEKQRGWAWDLSGVNLILRKEGVFAEGEPDISERSACHWDAYYDEGILPDDYPALNRWEMQHGRTPVQFIDPS